MCNSVDYSQKIFLLKRRLRKFSRPVAHPGVWGFTEKIVKKTREAKRWPARRTTVEVKKKFFFWWFCGSMWSTKIGCVLKKIIMVWVMVFFL